MVRGYFPPKRIWPSFRLMLAALIICAGVSARAWAAQQPAPDSTPQIRQIDPSQAIPGAHLTITITGSNFSAGATASSASNAIHIDSWKQISDTQLEVQVSVSDSAQPGTASLLVSNPSGNAAVASFSIVTSQSAPPQNSEPSKPGPPQAPATPPTPPPTPEGAPAPPAAPQTPMPPPTTPPAAEPAPPQAPTAPSTPPAPAEVAGPEVVSVTPPRLGQGFDIDLRVSGKNFVPGTKVSFANSGVRVVGIASTSATEITAHIKVAGDAPAGKTSLFVINPDDSEVEFPIEVALKGTLTPAPSVPSSPGAPSPDDPTQVQRFDAFHLASPTEMFHTHGKVKGSLVIAEGTVKYQEDNQTLINISLSEIKEVKTAGIGGVNIKLNSGKTHHFAASSLKGSDARTIVDAIQKAMPAPPPN